MPDTIRLYRVGPTPDEANRTFNSGDVRDWLRDAMNRNGSIGAMGRWFSSDPSSAEWYSQEHPAYLMRYVDVPKEDADRWMAKDHPTAAFFSSEPETDYFIPSSVANQAKRDPTIDRSGERQPTRELRR